MFRLNGGDTMIQDGQLLNYIAGKWQRSRASEFLDVRNPATAETMVRVPLSPAAEVDEAAQDDSIAQLVLRASDDHDRRRRAGRLSRRQPGRIARIVHG